MSRFLDQAKIYCAFRGRWQRMREFRREKYVEYGGPDGGDGGRGGDIEAEAVSSSNTLIDFRYRQHFKAQRGVDGAGQKRTRSKRAEPDPQGSRGNRDPDRRRHSGWLI